MARYIDADALIKKIFPFDNVDKKSYSINAKAVYEEIKKAPTVDVPPKVEVERYLVKESGDIVPISKLPVCEWISVKDRMPDTTMKEVNFKSQKKTVVVPVSAPVAVLGHRHINGEVELYVDVDKTVEGGWAWSEGVTHWFPLPDLPCLKGGDD
ncbi:MAG: DUF551 domain-containing protein [Ruminococcaceae bacterium]|nr:DUF551 domain-containing protein [Oscillospiraceae bacterium]